jgi:transcriptional regulator with XRE-family HTH domain
MAKKNTIAAIKIRQELDKKSLTGAELAKLADISYYTVENILAGKSSKIDKIEAIAKALGKPVMYFIDANYGEDGNSNSGEYDADMHYNVIKMISDFCKKNKIFLNKEKMDELIDMVYPRLNKGDPEDLMLAQTEAIVSYVLKTNKSF